MAIMETRHRMSLTPMFLTPMTPTQGRIAELAFIIQHIYLKFNIFVLTKHSMYNYGMLNPPPPPSNLRTIVILSADLATG